MHSQASTVLAQPNTLPEEITATIDEMINLFVFDKEGESKEDNVNSKAFNNALWEAYQLKGQKLVELLADQEPGLAKATFWEDLKKLLRIVPLRVQAEREKFRRELLFIVEDPVLAPRRLGLATWLRKYSLNSEMNLNQLKNVAPYLYISLPQIEFSQFNSKEDKALLAEFKQKIFDALVNPNATVEETSQPLAAAVTPVDAATWAGTKRFTLKAGDIRAVIKLYQNVEPEVKEEVLDQANRIDYEQPVYAKFNHSFSRQEAHAVMNELLDLIQQKTEADEEQLVNCKQYYMLARILCAAAYNKNIHGFFLGDPSDGWKPPEESQARLEARQQAKTLLSIFGSPEYVNQLEALWRLNYMAGNFSFAYECMLPFFALTPKAALGFQQTTNPYLWTKEKAYEARDEWEAKLSDLAYIAAWLAKWVASQDNARLNFNQSTLTNSASVAPSFILARALKWLADNGLDSPENKRLLYPLAERLAIFDSNQKYLCFSENDHQEYQAETAAVKAKVFNLVVNILKQQELAVRQEKSREQYQLCYANMFSVNSAASSAATPSSEAGYVSVFKNVN